MRSSHSFYTSLWMLLNFSVPQYKHLDIYRWASKQTGCSNLLEHMKSAEELQVKLSKSDLQFSAKSVELKYILVLVSAFYSVSVFLVLFLVFFQLLVKRNPEPPVGRSKKGGVMFSAVMARFSV